MLRVFCEHVLANIRPNWVLKTFVPCPRFTDVRNYAEEMTLVMTMSPSRVCSMGCEKTDVSSASATCQAYERA
ncbi:hypothetical protein A2U01_0062874 [Trifolium medium]|uniref:Uncharacterized protein n=1 Tax=Trifolium medium TaxID=97028 RepID=A0A392RYD1_9FABA|nr:hypothetical protein [Trifolium medium]